MCANVAQGVSVALMISTFLFTVSGTSLGVIKARKDLEYLQERASIPIFCQIRIRRFLVSKSCPEDYKTRFSACGVYKQGSCSKFCDKTVLVHAVKAQNCKHRPSLIDLILLSAACQRRCWMTRVGIAAKQRGLGQTVFALVQTSLRQKWQYQAKSIWYRPTRPVTLPSPEPKSNIRDAPDKKTVAAFQSCWVCRWLGIHCGGGCTTIRAKAVNRWDFQL